MGNYNSEKKSYLHGFVASLAVLTGIALMICSGLKQVRAEDGISEQNEISLIVFLTEEMSREEQEALAGSVEGTVDRCISGGIDALELTVPEAAETELTEIEHTLAGDPKVMYVTGNPVFEYTSGVNAEWITGNEAEPGGDDWWAEAIGAYTAWMDYGQYTNPITVTVLDDGFDTEHVSLKGKIEVLNENTINKSYTTWLKKFSHGTHVAALLAGENNGKGVRGVADHAQILAVDWKQKDESWISGADILSGISESVARGSRVVNMSFGIRTEKQNKYTEENLDESFESAAFLLGGMAGLYLNGYKDVLFVQSAGNNGVPSKISGYLAGMNSTTYQKVLEEMEIQNPENVEKLKGLDFSYFEDRTIIVGGLDKKLGDYGFYRLHKDSNYGDGIDLVAPYNDILSAGGISSHNDLVSAEGTSLSAPMVSGAAAFIWSMDLTMTPAEVKNYLIETAKVGEPAFPGNKRDTRESYPVLNVGRAAARVYEERILRTPSPDEPYSEQPADEEHSNEQNPEEQTPAEQNSGEQNSNEQITSDHTEMDRYVREVLIPEYGIIATDYLQMSGDYGAAPGWGTQDLNGLLSVTMRDFDGDGAEEMLAVIFRSADFNTELILEMYEQDAAGTVYQTARSILDTVHGFIPGMYIGYRQTSIFTYTYQGGIYIGIDSHILANESEATIAVFQYGGKGLRFAEDGTVEEVDREPSSDEFYYIGSAANNYHGEGGREILRSFTDRLPITPLCGATRYDPDTYEPDPDWSIRKEYVTYDESGNWVEPGENDDAQSFMDAYLAEMADFGLTADDPRMNAWEDPRYNDEHTMTPEIYSPLDGEITFISGIYTYRTDDMQTAFVRADYEGSLDMYR